MKFSKDKVLTRKKSMLLTNKSIAQQKEKAFEILDKMWIVNTSVVLAGGAPRDWDHGNLAVDFDYFIKDNEWFWYAERLSTLFGVEFKDITETSEEYLDGNQNWLHRVFEAYIDGYKINVMIHNGDSRVINHFPVSISKVYYFPKQFNGFDFDSGVDRMAYFDHLYTVGKEYKLIFVTDKLKEKYLSKLSDKFYNSGYKFVYPK
jgi:hypothetical protein